MKPSISILIPIKNEEKNILQCLSQLAAQTYEKNKMEIVVIDGMSTDKTRDIINDFKNKMPVLDITLLDDPKNQRASGMNIGIQNAKNEIILRIDARTNIANDYIEQCVKTLLATKADNVGGVQQPKITENLTQQAIGFAMAYPFGIGNAQFRLGKKSGWVDSVYLGCFWREIFNRIGYFDEGIPIISEDSDINYRIRKQGGKVYLNKDIIVHYLPRDTFSDLATLYFRYGGARAVFLRKWSQLTSWRQMVPPLFLTAFIVMPLLSLFKKEFLDLWYLMMAFYFAADIVSAWNVCHKQGKYNLFFCLLAVFPIIHFSWAAGFWVGCLQKNKRKLG